MAKTARSLTVRCLECIAHSPVPLRPVAVARQLGVSSNAVRVILLRLADRGAIVPHARGPNHVAYLHPSVVGVHALTAAINRWRR